MRFFPFLTVLAATIAALALLSMASVLKENERLKNENVQGNALLAKISRDLREANQRTAEANDRVAEATRNEAESQRRAASAEASLQRLVQATQPLPAGAFSGKAGDEARAIDPGQLVSATQARAQVLINQRKHEEALAEYLAAYRELRTRRRGGPEFQTLANAIQRLSQSHPPAKEALRTLRDSALQEFQASTQQGSFAALPGNSKAGMVSEIAILNQRLNEDRRSVEFHDSLAPNDPLRQPLRAIAFLQFVEMRRYQDALLGRPFGLMLTELEGLQRNATNSPNSAAALRSSYLPTAARHIEILTGAGRADEARMLTEKLFAFDNSEATKALVQQHVQRARQSAAP